MQLLNIQFLFLFSYVKGEFVNLAPYQKYKRMEDFIRKESEEWYLHHVNLRKEEEKSQDQYFSWSVLVIEGTYMNERRREIKGIMLELKKI